MARAKSTKRKQSTPPPPPPHRLASVFDDPPRNNVLLLTCMDQRLLDETVSFMNALNLHNRYDQLALAGGAMGVHRLNPPTSLWQPVFMDHLGAAIDVLHRPIKDVFLFEHLDCGAYKFLHPDKAIGERYKTADRDEMTEIHRSELNEFAWVVAGAIDERRQKAEAEFKAIQEACGKENDGCWERIEQMAKEKSEAWSNIRVSYFVIDLIGEVVQLDVPPDQRSSLGR